MIMEAFAHKILNILFGLSDTTTKSEMLEVEKNAKEAVSIYESVVMGNIL